MRGDNRRVHPVMRNTAKRVGLSMDYANEYLTDAPDYRKVTQTIFTELFKRGAIIEDLRPNIYDPVEGTTIADAEVERLQRRTKLVDVKWQTEDGEELIISTTRPELICACGIVVVHPDDDRYKHLIGKKAMLPLPVKVEKSVYRFLSSFGKANLVQEY